MDRDKKEKLYKKNCITFVILSYIIFLYVALRANTIMLTSTEEMGFIQALLILVENPLVDMFKFTPFSSSSLFIEFVIFTLCCPLVIVYKYFDKLRTMPTIEYGSAKFNKDIKTFKKNNMINSDGSTTVFTEDVGKNAHISENFMFGNEIGLNYKKNQVGNNHSLVVGGSGSGKSFYYVGPNLLQANTSFVVTDPKGELLRDYGKYLEKQGYKVKVFNLDDMKHSYAFNSFKYLRSTDDVSSMVNTFMENTGGKSDGKNSFWDQMTTLLLEAFCFYIVDFMKDQPEKQNWFQVANMVRQAMPETDEQEQYVENEIDKIMNEVEKKNSGHICVIKWKNFKSICKNEDTVANAVGSTIGRIAPFDNENVRNITNFDNIELDKIGREKTALFCLTPAANNTYNFLIAMLYVQLFNTLVSVANEKGNDGKLPVYVRFLLDEFPNICKIPNFDKYLAYVRSFGISISVIVQNLAQLKDLYKEAAKTIQGNCDTFLFLGSPEFDTCKYISDMLGKNTIREKENKHKSGEATKFKQLGRNLMDPNEVKTMPKTECIVSMTGMDPFKTDKIKTMNVPNFKKAYIGSRNPEDRYDIDKIPDIKLVFEEYMKDLKKEDVKEENVKEPEKERPEIKKEKKTNEKIDVSKIPESEIKENREITHAISKAEVSNIEDAEKMLLDNFKGNQREILEEVEVEEAFCPLHEFSIPDVFLHRMNIDKEHLEEVKIRKAKQQERLEEEKKELITEALNTGVKEDFKPETIPEEIKEPINMEETPFINEEETKNMEIIDSEIEDVEDAEVQEDGEEDFPEGFDIIGEKEEVIEEPDSDDLLEDLEEDIPDDFDID